MATPVRWGAPGDGRYHLYNRQQKITNPPISTAYRFAAMVEDRKSHSEAYKYVAGTSKTNYARYPVSCACDMCMVLRPPFSIYDSLFEGPVKEKHIPSYWEYLPKIEDEQYEEFEPEFSSFKKKFENLDWTWRQAEKKELEKFIGAVFRKQKKWERPKINLCYPAHVNMFFGNCDIKLEYNRNKGGDIY